MHRRWRTLVLPVALAAGLLAAACGGPSEGAADGIASAGDGSVAKTAADKKKKADPQQAGLDFARCMREHGVDMPDPIAGEGGRIMIGPGPGGDAGGPSRAAAPPAGFEAAHKACGHFLEDLVGDGPGRMDPAEQDRALKFAKCMRDNGVDMPDPDFSGGGMSIAIAPGSGGGPDSEAFKTAQKACGSFFGPAGGAGAGPAIRGSGS